MCKFVKHIFTGPDNETFELAHFLWALGVLSFLGMTIYYVYVTKSYPVSFGTDFLALNAGGAGGAFARAKADQVFNNGVSNVQENNKLSS